MIGRDPATGPARNPDPNGDANVPKATMLCGMLLTLLGVICYAFAFQLGAAKRSVTALIPAFLGVVLILLGYFAAIKPNLRMHLMHGAVTLALLGFLAAAGRFISVMVTHPNSGVGTVANLIMAIICAAFVAACVRSFIAARRSRRSDASAAETV
jgi:hypothetical protein